MNSAEVQLRRASTHERFGYSKSPDFDAILIQRASPETIRSWSHGETTKPETINYRSFKPERDGLFCERIFGPVKDWECHCGRYKRIRYRGVICDRCGVEVTHSKVRRERMGHIELAVPVSHIWYFKSLPSRIGYLLDIGVRNLEHILYYESYVVMDPGTAQVVKKDLLTEKEYRNLLEEGYELTVDTGAGAIQQLLAEIDIEELSTELRLQVNVETSVQRKQEALKRLKVVEAFRHSNNRPEWMIMKVIPVIPPDLRPLVPLEGGRFATSDLNDLYRRVINRNNRLKKLMEIKAPEIILRNEKRMLQESVDALFDNGRRSRAVRGNGNRSLRSLSDLLRGKQGRFRQNLLGKRVDYSGRSVIVVGPELSLHQCGLPKDMALELFKPFIIKKLAERGLVQTIKSAKKMVERRMPQVWDILENIIHDHCVLLNRAPTLHRLGILAFQPVLVEGKAIRIHPLVCAAFNADFDGDQMAVHVPLSFEAQIEANVLLLAARNILSPASGQPIVVDKPQCIILGCYYLTKAIKDEQSRQLRFSSPEEACLAYDFDRIKLNTSIEVKINGKLIKTTVGRIKFNEILPEGYEYVNKILNTGGLKAIVSRIFRELGRKETVQFLDKVKDIGFEYATQSGISISMDDVLIPEEKYKMIEGAEKQVETIQQQWNDGVITESERYNKIIDVWTHVTSEVSDNVFSNLQTDQNGFNPLFVMADSGARGSKDQIRQLAGMRGLMGKPQKKVTGGMGEIIESPITSNFREGLSVQEYFISTHGSRKGLADTALKTAEAGYLTRRLVDVAQDSIIAEEDCGTILGIDMEALKDGEQVIEPLADRILGRVPLDDVVDPVTGEVLAVSSEEIDEETAERIGDSSVEHINIRSVLTCESRRGVCAKCYGRNLGTGLMVDIGEAVGVIASQSIGEPGTQLTLRTFHIGGTADLSVEQSLITTKRGGRVVFEHVNTVHRKDGTSVVVSRNGDIHILDDIDRVLGRYRVPYGSHLLVTNDQKVNDNTPLYEWDPHNNVIVADVDGKVVFENIIKDVNFREEINEQTGHKQSVIIEQRDRMAPPPQVLIIGSDEEKLRSYHLPLGAQVLVSDGDNVEAGDNLAKIQKNIFRTRDITGGLPRVAELFEARRPKESAVVAEIEGNVTIGGLVRGSRKIIVTGESDEREYLIPSGKHLLVRDNDYVKAGERLCEGSVNPHDILRIQGIFQVQKYLVNEIQEVYRLQGVKINDKHIEVIVRQMLQKVRVNDPGDTDFLEGEQVDKFRFQDANEHALEEDREPATFDPILLGITKASLLTDSFISAASFQETTRVLTESAIQGRIDNLLGLKENVVIGHLIPAGTGITKYSKVCVDAPEFAEKKLGEEEILEGEAAEEGESTAEKVLESIKEA